MKLDISDLLKKETARREIHLELNEESYFDGRETIKFLQPIKFNGILDKVGDVINLTGTVNTLLELTCSRCIEKFSYAVELNIEEKFTNHDGVNKDDDVIFIDSDTIDITEIIENNIIVTLPIKRLCKEDCKGLCQQCGTNLNFSACNCTKDNIDPRLAKLKDMFLTD
ncbi:YceD family protein [Clostridium thailandense]|uniref:YceD family protein n=1 Tax=Clostridium thailandense TaxID=2794346 RepID=UPI0039895B3C